MSTPPSTLARITQSLSARLLLLTIAFVMLGEVLIYVPSIARYRLVYLEERVAASRLAAFALSVDVAPSGKVSPALTRALLSHAKVDAIALHRLNGKVMALMGDMPPSIDASFDLREATPIGLIRDGFGTLFSGGTREIQVMSHSPMDDPGISIEIVLHEKALFDGMLDYSSRILQLSLVLAAVTAILVFISLHFLMVRPMRGITASLVAFRERPEEEASTIRPSRRRDEVGIAQRELAMMQTQLRQALRQKTRLAALGEAVSKINHDLRNMLATVSLVSERLARVEDPEVKRVTPRLYQAIDRAFDFCTQTLTFARADDGTPERSRFALSPLVAEVGEDLARPDGVRIDWQNEVPDDLDVTANRDQLFRVLSNLARNAAEALARQPDNAGNVTVSARREGGNTVIEMADNGPGVPPQIQAHLFEPFTGADKPGGAGLGLAIARDLMRAHKGEIDLLSSDSHGSRIRLRLPEDA